MGALVSLLAAMPYCGWAQTVADSVAPIAFPDWQPEGEEAFADRFVLQFPSPVVSGYPANDVVQIHALLPKNRPGPVPAVVILHYWGATDHRVEINSALELVRRGIAGVVVSLPYHIERTPPNTRSGELAVTANPKKLVATMTQAILDLKQVANWIESRTEFSRGRMGITGASLGAIVAALAVGVEPRFTDAAFVVGGIDLADILWHSSRVVKEREQLRRDGFTEDRLRESLKPIEPGEHLSGNRLRNSYVVGARFDTVIPPADVEKLIDRLDRPGITWLDTGHYGGFFIQKRVQRSMADFFQKAFADQPFRAPQSLEAPTIRLGVAFDTRAGIEIAAGIDLMRPNRIRDPFATLLASPNGVRLMVGATLDRGLALGFVLQKDGLALGALWSFVL